MYQEEIEKVVIYKDSQQSYYQQDSMIMILSFSIVILQVLKYKD